MSGLQLQAKGYQVSAPKPGEVYDFREHWPSLFCSEHEYCQWSTDKLTRKVALATWRAKADRFYEAHKADIQARAEKQGARFSGDMPYPLDNGHLVAFSARGRGKGR